jgi:2-dehydropantoate 2-reductase
VKEEILMSVHIIGAGAIGLLLSYYLHRAGQDVTLITRTQEQAKEINKKGIVFKRDLFKDQFNIKAISFDECHQESIDCLVITVKSYQIEGILQRVGAKGMNFNSILFLSNGMSHVSLMDSIPPSIKVAVGVVEHGAMKETSTVVKHTGVGRIRWASVNDRTYDLDFFTKLNDPLFFPIVKEDNWMKMLEEKLIVNVCINPLTSLFQVQNGDLIHNRYYTQLMGAVFNEAMTILRRNDKEKMWMLVTEVCEKTALNYSSMCIDLKMGARTEVESISGYLIEKALFETIPHPTISFIHHAIKGREFQTRGGGA